MITIVTLQAQTNEHEDEGSSEQSQQPGMGLHIKTLWLVFCTIVFQGWINISYNWKHADSSPRPPTSPPDADSILPHVNHRITTSPVSGRRFLATVMSLPQDSTRRQRFFQQWNEAWPELNIVLQPTFKNHANLRGYGVLAGTVSAIFAALQFAQQQHDFDYLLLMEDDAIPFDNTAWPTTKAINATTSTMIDNDLDRMLDQVEARNGGALFLGAHGIISPQQHQLENQQVSNGTISELLFGFGNYAWLVHRKHLTGLYQHYVDDLSRKTNTANPPDWGNHFFFARNKIPEFVATPLLVDHNSPYSNTMQRTRTALTAKKWEGEREWWRFPPYEGSQSLLKHLGHVQ